TSARHANFPDNFSVGFGLLRANCILEDRLEAGVEVVFAFVNNSLGLVSRDLIEVAIIIPAQHHIPSEGKASGGERYSCTKSPHCTLGDSLLHRHFGSPWNKGCCFCQVCKNLIINIIAICPREEQVSRD